MLLVQIKGLSLSTASIAALDLWALAPICYLHVVEALHLDSGANQAFRADMPKQTSVRADEYP